MTLYTISQLAQKAGITRQAMSQRILRRRANGEKLGTMHGGIWLYTEAEVSKILEEVRK